MINQHNPFKVKKSLFLQEKYESAGDIQTYYIRYIVLPALILAIAVSSKVIFRILSSPGLLATSDYLLIDCIGHYNFPTDFVYCKELNKSQDILQTIIQIKN